MNDQNLLEDQPVAWTPTPDVIERAQLTKFMRQVGVSTWDELYAYSIGDVERFTEEVLKFLDIKIDPPYEKLLDTTGGIEFPEWFKRSADTPVRMSAKHEEGSRLSSDADTSTLTHSLAAGGDADKSVRTPSAGLNITTMCLDRWNDSPANRSRDAIVWRAEDPAEEGEDISYGELLAEVESCSKGLRSLGFVKGDAIGLHLPMIPETVVALLAINRIGAIAVPVFSGYGVEAVASRLKAVEAKGLFAATGFYRRGKMIDSLSVSIGAVESSPSVKHLIVVENYARIETTMAEPNKVTKTAYQDLIDKGDQSEFIGEAAKTSAEDPLIILYTSGTTGKPKGIAHTHASFPIKAAQDMAFGTDVGKGTRISWYTDIGWMMGPWLIYGALINGATICIYDGAPDYPTPDRMWEFCAKHKVEVLGISPTLVRSLATHGDDLPKKHDLSSLRIFASTGEPWNPAPWWWLFEKVGNSKLPIINYSGGTEIAGGILMGNPLLPIKPCSFPAPCPGMDVDILDEDGKPVPAGKVGELVIKQPWIGMARGFWQEKERYLDAYWRRFKNIWVHGDFAMRDKDNHWFILGRSDDTLKVAGKRVGPAEVESLLVAHPLVIEAAVIGVPDEVKGTAMVAFVVTSDKLQVTSEESDHDSSLVADHSSLEQELKTLVAKDMGKPLAPSKIHFVPALPKTRNAKVMRRVIRAAYLGEDAGDLSALEHPETVDAIRGSNPDLH